MINLRFCMQYHFYSKDEENAGEVKRLGAMHPQKAMEILGITYSRAKPQSMGEQWWFFDCKNLPDELPPFLTFM